ncbi:MAG: nicotinate-nucleotide--dimethylbenzimidazole phosphoribosyltransferase [Rhodobacteraceae bacterium]|nr:nicotinate-nucleotide--dimethylbenzimidazole phosphoribosyltransferase [Paracoccaceae bacterium]
MVDRIKSLSEFKALCRHAPPVDNHARMQSAKRERRLTKPAGALGKLEELAIWYAGWRGTRHTLIRHPQIIVFAANHGISRHPVSAYPASVTEQMVLNFHAGGAAINQLARMAGARLDIVEIDLKKPTRDFTMAPAMTEPELLRALNIGWNSVARQTDLLVVGEMGIGNTSSASAICLALYGGDASDWVGRGTGISLKRLEAKTRMISRAVSRFAVHRDPIGILRHFGGREIAAMTSAMVRARHLRVPTIIDGFICSAAAAVAHEMAPGILDHAIAGHKSAESAHGRLLARMGKVPLLDLGMRLGEGTGAAVAIQIVQCALGCHYGMATFGEAGVAEKTEVA